MATNNEQAKWYVIHTYSGYEQLVKDTIEKLAVNNNLQKSIIDIKIPMEQTIEEDKKGKRKVVMRKIMPCYVFVKMVYSNDMWFLLTNTRGVTGFVGPQGQAIALGEDEVKKMQLEAKVTDFNLEIGDEVIILSGQLESFKGIIKELNVETQVAKVIVTIFNIEQVVEQNFVQLEKIKKQI